MLGAIGGNNLNSQIGGNNSISQVQQNGNNQGKNVSNDQIAEKLASEHSLEELQKEYQSLSSGGGSVIGNAKGAGGAGAPQLDNNTKLDIIQKALVVKQQGGNNDATQLSADSQDGGTAGNTNQISAFSNSMQDIASQ
ncbi:MAG: hypothetical protein ABRQ37_07440 [Candidatus Eremiobacterota bacterium]